MRSRSEMEGGFTLIEVMVAALLLLLVLIPALGMMISSVQAALQSETQNAASLLAQEQIEELRSYDYDSLRVDQNKLTGATVTALGLTAGTDYPYAYTYGTSPATYDYVSDAAGTIDPVETVKRRNVVFTVHRYILAVAGENHRKVLIRISWNHPKDGDLLFETDMQEIGRSGNRPPLVNISYPYYGDAFTESTEITPTGGPKLTASATDADGEPQGLVFQYKKNVDANFSKVADGAKAYNTETGEYDYTAHWGTTITAENQYNFRAEVRDDEGAVSIETIPFFLDTSPPLPPTATVTNADGSVTELLDWPARVAWDPIYDYIAGNSNYNMVSGYIVYRDERSPGDDTQVTEGTSPVATLFGAENTSFIDMDPPADLDVNGQPTKEYRYRVKSMGRAKAWRSTKLDSVSEYATGWFALQPPEVVGDDFTAFTAHPEAPSGYQLHALATSWSAIDVAWLPQYDSADHRATVYVVERTPDMTGTADWGVVATVWDPPGSTETVISYQDEGLDRNTTYQYQVTPKVHTEKPLTNVAIGTSDQVDTEIY